MNGSSIVGTSGMVAASRPRYAETARRTTVAIPQMGDCEVIVVPPAGWNVEIQFEEDESLTTAASLLRLTDGTEIQGRGQARRNPADPAQPQIGEEIAAARALSDLVHQLLDKAAAEIEDVTHKPAHLSA